MYPLVVQGMDVAFHSSPLDRVSSLVGFKAVEVCDDLLPSTGAAENIIHVGTAFLDGGLVKFWDERERDMPRATLIWESRTVSPTRFGL
jgi:hypothetical protein